MAVNEYRCLSIAVGAVAVTTSRGLQDSAYLVKNERNGKKDGYTRGTLVQLTT